MNNTFEQVQDMANRQHVDITPAKRAKLLEQVAKFSHQRFLDSACARDYLSAVRGIRNAGLFRDFRVGLGDGSLRQALPQDAETLATLRAVGILDGRSRDAFEGYVVFPLFDAAGAVVNLYGRRIADDNAKHRMLAEDRGVWNYQAIRRAHHLLITGSIIDSLTLVDRGLPDNVPCFSDSLNQDHLALLQKSNVKSVTLCVRAGDPRATVLEKQFVELGIAVQVAVLPDGHDVNSFLSKYEIGTFQVLLPKEKATAATGADMRCERTPYGFVLVNGKRQYEVKGLDRQATQLRAFIKATSEKGRGHFVDGLDLISARSRQRYSQTCAELFEEQPATISADLNKILEHAETWTSETEADVPAVPVITDKDREAGLALLRDPKLLERIEADLTALGIAGESMNKRVIYIAATSRKLDAPLSLLIQSRSAAGKSTLQKTVLSLVPDEDKLSLTRMTDQALFYQDSLAHKLIALEEADGLGGAAYGMRALQSSGQLTNSRTSKDPVTGKMKAEENVVKGPVSVMVTTTSAALDDETASRFLTVTVDESTEMTERIFEHQREAATLEGYLRQRSAEALIAQHQAAQRLLEPLKVFIPQAMQLVYPAELLRSRRDHAKYLALIKAVAFLHQKQRAVKELIEGDNVTRYINATREDIRAANAIAEVVFAQSASELSQPARKLLGLIHKLMRESRSGNDITARQFTFTRRALREALRWGETQIRNYMAELQELEYVYVRVGAKGKEYVYELASDGSEPNFSPTLTLANPDELVEPA